MKRSGKKDEVLQDVKNPVKVTLVIDILKYQFGVGF